MIDTFILVHDQELILTLEKNNVFRNLKSYRYVFLGMRPVDKLKDLMEKIVLARELPNNIEDKKCLYDYTGCWAIANNPSLAKSEFVNIIHYDCLIFKDFLKKVKKALKQNRNSFISYQPHPLTCKYFINDFFAKGLIEATREVYGLDIFRFVYELITKGDKFWQGGGSYACSYENLKKYTDWVDPLLPYIEKDKMAAHNIERTVKFFCAQNKLKEVFIPEIMEHIYNASHDQDYQDPRVEYYAKKRFNELLEGKLFGFNYYFQKFFSYKRMSNHSVLKIFGLKLSFKTK